MALFKVLRGNSASLMDQPLHDGYAYFTPDDGRFYIDVQLDTPPYLSYMHGTVDGKTVYRIEIESKTWAELITTKSDIGHEHIMHEIVPVQTKTYTNIIGTADTWNDETFFYGSIKPIDWYAIWKIKYRIRTYVPGKNGYDQTAEVVISGDQATMRSYASMNTVSTAAAYYHELYRLKIAGFNAGYGHALGVTLRSTNYPMNTNYKRTIVVDILDTENCTFTFFDNCLKYTEIPGTGDTNYTGYTEMNYCSNGLQETGDNNDVNYQNRVYYTSRKTIEQLYRYQLLLSTKDKDVIPISSANNDYNGTTRTYTEQAFDPFGEIFYYNSTTAKAANENVGNATLYRQVLADFRYSFPVNATNNYKLTARQPVYLVARMQANGTAVLVVPTGSIIGPLTQTLPSEEDGLIYIYLGQAYEDTYPYRVELTFNHPIYVYKNGRITEYIDASTVNGHTVQSDVPANYSWNKSLVTISNLTASGNKVADITIDGTENTLYAPAYTGTSPISISGLQITHTDSGVSANTYGTTSTSALTPSFGATFSVPGFTVNAKGHITAAGAHTVKIPSLSYTATKSSGIELGKININGNEDSVIYAPNYTGTAPISVSNDYKISHATSGPSSSADTSKGDTTNQTPSFGSTFKVTSATVNKYGHTTALAEHTVKIPTLTNTPAYSEGNGTFLVDTLNINGTESKIYIPNYPVVTAEDLGLNRALRFIGFASTSMTDGQTATPTVTGLTGYTPATGDVVIDSGSHYEYVYTSGGSWEKLGGDDNYVVGGTSYDVTNGGTNASSTVTITPSTTNIYSITSVGSIDAVGVPASFSMSVTNEKLTFSWETNTPTRITLPTRSSNPIAAWTGYTAASAAAQTFTPTTKIIVVN